MSSPALALAALVLALAVRPAAAQAVARLDGQVVAADGAPLPGASVALVGRGARVAADARGRFCFDGLAPGRYVVEATFLGFRPARDTVALGAAGATLRLVLAETAGALGTAEVVADADRRAQPSTVVSREALDRTGAGTLAGALARVPGVAAITVGVGIAKPVVRGFSMSRVAVVESGVEQEGQQWGADHGLEIDPFSVSAVEVVKGPGALRYGPDAAGGVIDVLPPLVPAEGVGGSVEAVFKANNLHAATSAHVEGRRGGLFAGVRVTAQDFGDTRVPADTFVYNSFVLPIVGRRLKNTAGRERNARLDAGLVRPWGTVRASVSRYGLDAGLFPGAVGIPRAYGLGDDGSRRDVGVPGQSVRHDRATLGTTLRLGRTEIEATAGVQRNLRRERSNPDVHNVVAGAAGTLALELDLLTTSLNAEVRPAPLGRLAPALGVAVQHQRNRRGGFEFLLPGFRSASGGVYALAEHRTTRRVTLSGGLRLDAARHATDGATVRTGTDAGGQPVLAERAAALDRRFLNVAGALGVTVAAGPAEFRLHVARSHRAPAPVELAANGVHHGTFRHEQGTPGLVAERGLQLDAEVRLSGRVAGRQTSARVSPFVYRFRDYIFLNPTALFSTLPDAGQLYRHEQADALYAGAEAEADVAFAPWLGLRASAATVWNRNLDTGRPLPFTPPLTLVGAAEWTPRGPGGPFAALTATAAARQSRVARNEPATPGYATLDVSAGTTLRLRGAAVRLLATVQNALDARFLGHLSRYRVLGLPEQGRNVVFSLRFQPRG